MLDLENIREFLNGATKFYTQFSRRETIEKSVWQEGSTSILDYTNNPKLGLPILFFIPSLINKSYILDLTEKISMVKYFAKLGYPVYLVNFSESLSDEASIGFNEYLTRITLAMEAICGNQKIITIGYCLGGIFSLALHAQKRENLIGQILIATPWDLSHLKEVFGLNNPLILKNVKLLFKNCNKISPYLIQLSFSSLNPSRIWEKFCKFSNMQQQEDIDNFLKIEQWVNDGVCLTKKFALEALSMIENNDLQNEKLFSIPINAPCLSINGLEDKIVPASSCKELYKNMSHHKNITENTGHIGLIVSKLSREKIWPEIEKWLSGC
jgi:polyhydroxyalkanoate synthase